MFRSGLDGKPSMYMLQLQKIYSERPDGKGGMAPSDTWDNAKLNTDVIIAGQTVPMTLEMKSMAREKLIHGIVEVLGTEGGVRYSTKAQTLWIFKREKNNSGIKRI